MIIPDVEQPESELIKSSATTVVEWLKNGKVSPSELLDALESRIEQVDGTVNALPTLCFDRARNAIRDWDAKQAAQTVLAGLPVPIKDLNDVKGVKNTHGSLVYENHISEQSDILVEQIERQGGVVYAKSNTPEFGTGGNTYNKVFGATHNPWRHGMSVAGSSGGAAAALATGTAWVAHGSDLGGSLRNPASFCGVVGMRPTVGRVASSPGGRVFDTMATHGPMARNVEDLALLFDAMVGHHDYDPLSFSRPQSAFLDAARQKRLPGKIAFSLTLGITPVDSRVAKVVTQAAEKLEQAGVIVEEAHPDFDGLHEIFHIFRAFSYASGYGELIKTHEDILNQDVIWNTRQGLELSTADIARAEAMRVELVGRVARFFDDYDLIITPATIVPAYSLDHRYVEECDGHRFDNYYQWLSIAYAFTTAVCPALSMPCGFTEDGLPVGLQVASKAQNEAGVLSAANAFEDIFGLKSITPINPVS